MGIRPTRITQKKSSLILHSMTVNVRFAGGKQTVFASCTSTCVCHKNMESITVDVGHKTFLKHAQGKAQTTQ